MRFVDKDMRRARAVPSHALAPPHYNGSAADRPHGDITPVPREDSELVQACLAGDADAWNELVERFGRLVYSIPRRYGLNSADGDDVFQSVFTLLHRRLAALRDPSRLSSWLITTTHRECWRVGKKSGGYAQLDERIADVSTPQDDELVQWERQQIVQQSLAELGGPCERLLRALFIQKTEPKYDEVSASLGIPIGSIGPQRARCFKKLEAILRRRGI